MSRLEERENLALSSLHDISDYSNYIEQRISKLNNLYESLNIPSISGRHAKGGLTRQSQQIKDFGGGQKMFRTKEEFYCNHEQMYRTQYAPIRRDRYQLEDNEQLKSITLSHFRHSLDVSRTKPHRTIQEAKTPITKKLEIYRQVKEDILGSFYVGGQTLTHKRAQPRQP